MWSFMLLFYVIYSVCFPISRFLERNILFIQAINALIYNVPNCSDTL